MNRTAVLEYLGEDWSQTCGIFNDALRSDVNLLQKTNESIVRNSGKQLRPILSLLMARALGSPNDDSWRYAAATELLHNATLLHDDVADNSGTRRGAPTIMALLGPSPAVLLGDFWLSRAVDVIIDSKRCDSVVKLFSKTMRDLAEGEMLQLEKASTADTAESDYLRIVYCKTASLFEAALLSAAISVDASHEQCELVRRYAKALGTAFQIKDDILDYAGSEELGKPVGLDLKEGKITMPLLCALEGSDCEEHIRELARRRNDSDCEELKSFVASRDGVGKAAVKLSGWVDMALEALDPIPDSRAKEFLAEIVRYNIFRNV